MRTSVKLGGEILLALTLVALTGCVSLSWHQARDMDTVAAYHRFLREHSDSGHAEEARERLEYHRIQVHPTVVSFEGFQDRYPNMAATFQSSILVSSPASNPPFTVIVSVSIAAGTGVWGFLAASVAASVPCLRCAEAYEYQLP